MDAQKHCSILKHDLSPPKGLIECKYVVEFGPGIRPFNWYNPKRYTAVEPYLPYCDVLKTITGAGIVNADALSVLRILTDDLTPGYDIEKQVRTVTVGILPQAIYMLDVIEHMEKDEGKEVLELAKTKAKRQVVVYTPHGFQEQTEDAWGLGGDYWQTHRSGWTPDDFEGWHIEDRGKAFFALFTA